MTVRNKRKVDVVPLASNSTIPKSIGKLQKNAQNINEKIYDGKL